VSGVCASLDPLHSSWSPVPLETPLVGVQELEAAVDVGGVQPWFPDPLETPLVGVQELEAAVDVGGVQSWFPLEAELGTVWVHWLDESSLPEAEVCISPPGATVPAVCVTSFSPPNSMAEEEATKVAARSTAEVRWNRLGAISDNTTMGLS
jgi:hypothetical protein